nr:immunoglobulin heavy chain junction region [Macaca mulatta]MOV50252.1 immunoglobulin heavy chain junction region [Macaca mulatta]
CARAHVLWDFW